MAIPESKNRRRNCLEGIIVLIILGIVAFTSLKTIQKISVTPDEIVHITAGLSYLQKRDGRMNPEHPPLLKILSVLPLAVQGVKPAYTDSTWKSPSEDEFGAASFYQWGPEPLRVANVARLPMILLILLLGLTIFCMARSLAGAWGGFLSLVLFASTPFFLAYGPLVHTDIGVALFSLLAVWAFATLWRDPNWKTMCLFALSSSGAFLSKFSSGILLPTFFVLVVWFGYELRKDVAFLKRVLWLSSLGLAISAGIVYVSYSFLFWKTNTAWLLLYKFHHSPAPIHEMYVVGEFLLLHHLIERVLFPVILYFLGVGSVLHRVALAKPTDITYILGRFYPHGTPKFFLVLMFYKMTPGFLLLMGMLICLAVWGACRKTRSRSVVDPPSRFHLRAICVLVALFGGACLASHLNIGIRHLSVAIAGMVVLASLVVPLARVTESCTRIAILVIGGMALCGGIYSTAASFPNYISYFNAFRRHKPKDEIAIDSNLDWGQSVVQLHEFMIAKNISKITVESVGPFPGLYIPHASQFDCLAGAPAEATWVAVGANVLVRAHGRCDYLLAYPHWPIAGGASYVFQVPPHAP